MNDEDAVRVIRRMLSNVRERHLAPSQYRVWANAYARAQSIDRSRWQRLEKSAADGPAIDSHLR